jgi:hypothetical protein
MGDVFGCVRTTLHWRGYTPGALTSQISLVGDEEVDGFAAVSPANADVVEAAEVAEKRLFSLIGVAQGGISQREGVTGTETVADGEI